MLQPEITMTRNAWNGIAAGYDEHVTPSHFALGAEGIRRVGLRAGMTFLDVAAGSGGLSLPAARLGARVTSTDLSPVMVERLAARAEAEGLEVETRVMDGQALDLEDDSFDVAGSQFGVMLFPDMPKGVKELARVTKPGGRVLMHAYGSPKEIEFLQFFVRGVRAVVPAFPGIPTDPPPLPLQLQDPARLRQVLEDAGLREVSVETFSESLHFATGDDLWSWLTSSNPVVEGILSELELGAEQRIGVLEALRKLVAERRNGNERAVLTNPIHIGIGTK